MMLLKSQSDASSCRYCGSHVTRDFRRVYGDSNNHVHRCRECDTLIRLQSGSAAGLSVSVPDPQHAGGRHGGSPEGWSK
ncbi:hypothetical protein FQA18_11270 [Haloferax volcanii]|uniref:Small CPxCG-related zinc finger protein n=1 Tax=Haloferax volcanii TaxID=2246 RepID=A0A558G9X3_HALVO|nr:hypothetical protein FQA18_11270 [Haloferax volcanii]